MCQKCNVGVKLASSFLLDKGWCSHQENVETLFLMRLDFSELLNWSEEIAVHGVKYCCT